jgi:hypothetical protein
MQCAMDTNPVTASYFKAWAITCGRDAAVYCTHGQTVGTRREQVVYQTLRKVQCGYQKGEGKDASMTGVRTFDA